MSDHKFKIGQVVNYNPRSKLGAGVYQIAQLMPPAGCEPQYRIKSETEGQLRAAMESELSRTSTAADGCAPPHQCDRADGPCGLRADLEPIAGRAWPQRTMPLETQMPWQ